MSRFTTVVFMVALLQSYRVVMLVGGSEIQYRQGRKKNSIFIDGGKHGYASEPR